MIQTYTAQLDGECMSVWNQTATSLTITQYGYHDMHCVQAKHTCYI